MIRGQLARPTLIPRPLALSPLPPPAAAVLVWAVWGVMLWVAFAFVHRYAGRAPVHDDLVFLSVQLDPAFPSPRTLWEPFNEHRLPLPKLASWGTARVAGYDLPAQMRVNLALLAAAAAALVVAARAARGTTRPTDAFFPLLLLSVGQWENLLWAIQINFALPVFLTAAVLALVATAGPALSTGRAAVVGVALLALSLCGVQGLVPAIPLGGWLVAVGFDGLRRKPRSCGPGFQAGAGQLPTPGSETRAIRKRRAAFVALGFGAATLAVVAAYFATLSRDPNAPLALDGRGLRYALRVCAAAWGPAGELLEPPSPGRVSILGAATATLAVVTGVMVALAVRSRDRRVPAAGVALFLAAGLALCLGIGASRAAVWGTLVHNRYVTLAAPVLCGVYLAWVRFGPPLVAKWVTGGLCLTAVAFAWPNAARGHAEAWQWTAPQFLLADDIARGVPMSFLLDHHGHFINGWPADNGVPTARAALERLKAAGVKPFDRIAPEPTLWEVPTAWRVAAAVPPAGPDGTFAPDGLDPVTLRVTFDRPPNVRGLVVRYTAGPGSHGSEIAWHGCGPTGVPVSRVVAQPFAAGTGAKRFWLAEDASEITVRTSGGSGVRIDGVSAIVSE